jgi:diaminohydroxyphosphoribosylaminopyrimidine deaminase / 5-amino-6-(5-phosphoribosylamino)uracil reductase
MKKDHAYFMDHALRLALKAKGLTSPNPLVGALVVKDGRIIGRGYHEKAGLPHAEIIALDDAGATAKGATLYVTLEPCTHFGKTPPCVDRIIQSGVKRVVVGMVDPNPVNNGKGIQLLRNHKIAVEVGFCEEKLRFINEAFIKFITRGFRSLP